MPQQSGLSAQLGLVAEVYTNEVQTLTGAAGGAWTIGFDGATSTSLVSLETAANVQAALRAMPNVGPLTTATGGPLGSSPITVTFADPLTSKRNVPALTSSLGANPVIATSTPGTGYGDPPTCTRFLEFTKENVSLEFENIESKGIRSGNTVLRTDRFKRNKKGVKGDFELEVPTKGFGLVLAHAFGKDAVITTPGGGTNTRDQTFTLGDTFNRSLTIQTGVPDTMGGASNVRAFTEVGCKVTDLELDCDVDGFLQAKVSIDGQNERTDVALASASYASAFENLTFVGAQCTIQGANVNALKASFKLSRSLATQRYFLRSSTLKAEPLMNDLLDIGGSIELEFVDLTQYNRFASATEAGSLAAVTMLFAGSLIEVGFNYQLLLTMPQCRFDGASPEIDGMDVVAVEYPFKCLWDGSVEPVTAVYRSTDVAQ